MQSSKDLKKVEKRFALGYPMIKPFSQDDTYYTSDDLTINPCKAYIITRIGDVEYVVHSAKISDISSGGSLVDAYGNVVGIIQGNNTDGMEEAYSYAIATDDLL